MGAADKGDDQGGCGFLDLGPYLLGSGTFVHALQVGSMGDDTPHLEGFGRIPPQGGLQADREGKLAREGKHTSIPPTGGSDGGYGTAGVGVLSTPPT